MTSFEPVRSNATTSRVLAWRKGCCSQLLGAVLYAAKVGGQTLVLPGAFFPASDGME
jgi:hypothetical protein